MTQMVPRIVSLVAGLTLLGNCVSVLPAPETAEALYRISPATETYMVSMSVIIREPDASRMFAGRSITSQAVDGSLRLIPRVEWADTATRMLQIALLDTLEPAKDSTDAAVLASDTGLNGDIHLAWRIIDFVVDGSNARCQLELTLLDGQNLAVISQTSVSTHAVAVSDGSRDRAIALSEAARECVSEAAIYVAATANFEGTSE